MVHARLCMYVCGYMACIGTSACSTSYSICIYVYEYKIHYTAIYVSWLKYTVASSITRSRLGKGRWTLDLLRWTGERT